MNVLSIVLGSDPAGISAGMARAFDHHGDGWSLRSVTTKQNYIDYLIDTPFDNTVAAELWQGADVVHLHHGFVSADRIVRGRFLGRGLAHKPYLVEFHGTGFRENATASLRELVERRAVGTVSTLDMYLIAPHLLTWTPPPVNVEAMQAMSVSQKQSDIGRVLIVHAPTNRGIKSTDVFLEAVKRLQDEGFPVDLDLIEHRPWKECLERKAKADIYFDQVILGYGCNAIEAWGMGIPVVAGAQDDTLDEMERRFGGLPFYHATEETIYDALKELVESPELRARWGRIGLEHVRKYHDEVEVVEQLKALYQRAMDGQMDAAA